MLLPVQLFMSLLRSSSSCLAMVVPLFMVINSSLSIIVRNEESSGSLASLQIELSIGFVDTGPEAFCGWAPQLIGSLLNESNAYDMSVCSRTGSVLPSSAKALFDACQTQWVPGRLLTKEGYCAAQCTAAYDALHIKPLGFYSLGECQCGKAAQCVDGELIPKIPKLSTDTGSLDMWARAIASPDWRFRTATCETCGCSCWIACTPAKLMCDTNGKMVPSENLTYNDVSKYMYADQLAINEVPSNTRSGIYTIRAQKPVSDFSVGTQDGTFIIDWASTNLSDKVLDSLASPGRPPSVLFRDDSARLTSVILQEQNLPDDQLVRIISAVGYIGIAPESFVTCAQDFITSVVPYCDEISVLIDSNSSIRAGITCSSIRSVYLLIKAVSISDGGTIFTQCGGSSGIFWNSHAPLATIRSRGKRKDVPATSGLGWWAWMLIGLCILLFIGLILSVFIGRYWRTHNKGSTVPLFNPEDTSSGDGVHRSSSNLVTPTAAVDPETGVPVLPFTKKNPTTPNTIRSLSQLSSGTSSINPRPLRVAQESPF